MRLTRHGPACQNGRAEPVQVVRTPAAAVGLALGKTGIGEPCKECATMISGPSRFRLILFFAGRCVENRGSRGAGARRGSFLVFGLGQKSHAFERFIFSLILRRAWLFPYFVVCCCFVCAVFYAEEQGKLWGRSSPRQQQNPVIVCRLFFLEASATVVFVLPFEISSHPGHLFSLLFLFSAIQCLGRRLWHLTASWPRRPCSGFSLFPPSSLGAVVPHLRR